MTTLAPFLWFDRDAEEAVRFYTATFPDSRVDRVVRSPLDVPGSGAGDVLMVDFTLLGRPCAAMNGGPGHPPTDAFSFQVLTEDQAETDRYWQAIVGDGGRAIACGWCADRWGVSWQITPRVLIEAIADPDAATAKRVMEAMMGMVKIDVATIEAARAGGPA